MPSNDDMQHQNEEAMKSRVSGDVAVANILPGDHAADADKTGADEVSTDVVGTATLSSDHCMPRDFTFFQKKKRPDQALLSPSVDFAGTAQVAAFVARLDTARAVNNKTQRHIAELMILMSDVTRTMTVDASRPTRKRLCWSKWLFYGCLVICGAGWFLLLPSGHHLMTQLAVFLAR